MVPELKTCGLTVSLHGKEILHNIDLTVRQGELLSLLGPSGCGKSTFLKTVAGLLEPACGEVYIRGREAGKKPTERRGAVIVFQDLRLFPNLSVAGNVEFSLKLQKVPRKEREERVRELLQMVHLSGLEKRRIQELSGGQMQRVALARALAAQPQLLLLDEPFCSLDEQLREEIRCLVQELHQKTGMTVILVTHDREEALSMSDRIALMIEGRIVQTDSPERIYRCPAEKCVSDYFGGCSYLCGRVEQGRFYHPDLEVLAEGYADGLWSARILPGMVHLKEGSDWEVTKVRYQGESSRITLEKNGAVLTARSDTPIEEGIRCGVELRTEELVLFQEEAASIAM